MRSGLSASVTVDTEYRHSWFGASREGGAAASAGP